MPDFASHKFLQHILRELPGFWLRQNPASGILILFWLAQNGRHRVVVVTGGARSQSGTAGSTALTWRAMCCGHEGSYRCDHTFECVARSRDSSWGTVGINFPIFWEQCSGTVEKTRETWKTYGFGPMWGSSSHVNNCEFPMTSLRATRNFFQFFTCI